MSEHSTTALQTALRGDIEVLAGDIGERNAHHPLQLAHAADYLFGRFTGIFDTARRLPYHFDGQDFLNLEVELRGVRTPDEVVVVGAHYDSARGTPGANDNASGVATVLALATWCAARAARAPARTLRFVAFANEERPFFWRRGMGSLVYARQCRARGEKIVAMLTPETLGYYTDAPASQRYPWPFHLCYPSMGNFVGFVGMLSAWRLVRQCVRLFRAQASVPCHGAALPAFVPRIIASDHSSFWRCGYPALMITDTANFRYPHYHSPRDTPEKLNYACLTHVVEGLCQVVWQLAGGTP